MDLLISDLSKTYPNGVQALANINLQINQGMFGLLGPNGAGKSTLMRTIATLQSPDHGTVQLGSVDALKQQMELRKVLGYLPQEFGVYPRISAIKLLDYLARLKGIYQKNQRQGLLQYCLEITNLWDVRKKAVSSYSGGMKQRFGIAQILLNKPKLIIVDEPTAGLDPAERQRFLNILREISTESIVIFSTHIVDDIKDLCTDMAILSKGRVVNHSTPEKALDALRGQIFTTDIGPHQLSDFEKRYCVLSSAFNRDHSIRIRIKSDVPLNQEFNLVDPILEDFYFTSLLS